MCLMWSCTLSGSLRLHNKAFCNVSSWVFVFFSSFIYIFTRKNGLIYTQSVGRGIGISAIWTNLYFFFSHNCRFDKYICILR